MSAILKQKLIDIANGFTKYGLWKGGGSGNLSELYDVTLTNLKTNDVLTYNGSVWVNDDNLQKQIDTLNSNLKPIDSIPSSGYKLIDDGSFLDRDIQHIKCRIFHPIVKTSAYLNIGTLPHQVKKTCYTTTILLYGSNVYPLIIKLQGNTISMFNSIAIQSLDNGTQVESWIDCEYLIAD